MSYLPSSLKQRVERLHGFRKNTHKSPSANSGDYKSGTQIRIPLSAGAIIDMKTLALKFTIEATPSDLAKKVSFPRYAASLFERFEVLAGSNTLAGGSLNQYGDLFNVVANIGFSSLKKQEMSIYEGGTDSVVASETAGKNTKTFVVTNFLGLFSSSLTRFLPAHLLGSAGIELRLVLKNDSVLAVESPATATFIVKDVTASYDILSFGPEDPWTQYLEGFWAQGLPIELPFIDWSDHQSSTGGESVDSTFPISADSVDSIWTVIRATSYAASQNAYTSLTSDYYKFTAGSTPSSARFSYQINGTSYPNNPQTVEEVYNSALKLSTLDVGSNPHYSNTILSAADWTSNKFVVPISLEFNHDRSSSRELLVSGMNTRGSQIPVVFKAQSTGLTSGFVVSHFVQQTKSIKIHPGGSITVSS